MDAATLPSSNVAAADLITISDFVPQLNVILDTTATLSQEAAPKLVLLRSRKRFFDESELGNELKTARILIKRQ